MPHWLDDLRSRLNEYAHAFESPEAYQAHADWAVQKHRSARAFLTADALDRASPREIYDALKQICLNVEALPFRIARIADANEADRLRMGLLKLATTKGTAEDKMRAAGLRQFGEATLTEILCIYAPRTFVMRSRPVMKGITKLCELYSERHLRDMAYREFADLVGEMEKVQREVLLSRLRMEDFYLDHKCLLICLFLAEHAGKGKRPYA